MPRVSSGTSVHLGAVADEDGVNFALFSEHAERVELCLFTPDGSVETDRIPLPERSGAVWHGHVSGLTPGALYGYRVHGPYQPEQGHRFNPAKLLLDPYAGALAGRFTAHPATCGYNRGAPEADLSFDSRDSAPFVAKAVVTGPEAAADRLRPADPDLVYEAHPKGLTMQHPGVPEALRGTYEGLASDAMLEHLTTLGVTAIELLPVHAMIDDAFLLKRGLVNYWGYNTIGFFTPEPRYFGPSGMAGFRQMVARFHAAGIAVILDVVYNHTAEADHLGPTLSFRGIDNASYYRLERGNPRYYVNDTGCGNTLNVAHPFVLRMVLDSLRHWVTKYGIDGFRFDLATTLAREDHGFDSNGGFLDALRQDPVLAGVQLIAEPWDIGPGGYQLGHFPPEFREWNDRFRDGARRFWRGDAQAAQGLAACLLGSAGAFDRGGRRAVASVNFVSAHDGFTLADTTTYNDRHNLANGEDGRDGHPENFSDNCGSEGETDNPEILARRIRRQKNLLATLMLAQGTPMLLAGDEIANSQGGNNNAYCQDNSIGWVNWPGDADLSAFVTELSAFRRAHPCLRQSRFLHGRARHDGRPDVEWTDLAGGAPNWQDAALAAFGLIVRGSAEAAEDLDDSVFLAFNRSSGPLPLNLPDAPEGWRWHRALDTAGNEAGAGLAADSVAAFVLEPDEAGA